MDADKYIRISDFIIGRFMMTYMLFMAALFIVLACLPSQTLVPSNSPLLIPIWQVRVGCLVGVIVALFGARAGREFGESRSHRKTLEEIDQKLALLVKAK